MSAKKQHVTIVLFFTGYLNLGGVVVRFDWMWALDFLTNVI
jgi:hypothetical protein